MTITRRAVLAGGGIAASSGLVGGCTTQPQGSTEPGTEETTGNVLPDYIPYVGVTPDGPTNDQGAQPYFEHYPADPPSVLSEPPGNGGTVKSLCLIPTPRTPVESNTYWQGLNEMLGTSMEFVGAPISDYNAKFSTMVAGGEIPDMAQIFADVADLPGLLEARFEDLTELLSGDAIQKYPNLANIPTYAWPNAVFSGRLYGVPKQRQPVRTWAAIRGPEVEAAGVDPQPTDGQEFMKLCQALTRPKENQWALRSPAQVLGWVNAMVGTPNVWQVEGGNFTSAFATEQYKQALGIVQDLWKKGCFEPDTLAVSGGQMVTWYVNGRVPMFLSSSTWAVVAQNLLDDSGTNSIPIRPPKWEGGGMAKAYLGNGVLSFTGIKKTGDAERTDELLRVLDALSAPFGTKEYLQKAYGVEGHNYTLDGTDPIVDTEVTNEKLNAAAYIANPPAVHYQPAYPDLARTEYEMAFAAMEDAWPWPTAGLYSATDMKDGAGLNSTINAIALDIMVDRAELSTWDEAVDTWKAEGGDTIAAEYAEALQRSGGA